jgi:hypothetical protein
VPLSTLTLSTWVQKTRTGPHSKVKRQKVEGARCSFTLPHRWGMVGPTPLLSIIVMLWWIPLPLELLSLAPRVLCELPKMGFGHLGPAGSALPVTHSSSIMTRRFPKRVTTFYWICVIAKLVRNLFFFFTLHEIYNINKNYKIINKNFN